MNNESWLKFVPRSREAHHIREIFNGTYMLIDKKHVQDVFFNQIDKLLGSMIDAHTRKSLEDLREDIEDEIETGAMRSKVIPFQKPAGRPFAMSKQERILSMIDRIEDELEKLKEMVGSL